MLIVRHRGSGTATVGALGEVRFRDGFYTYAGSAFGPGGLNRVQRHQRTAEEGTDPHWHIDHLLVREDASVEDAVTFPGEDIECRLAGRMGGERVDGFGCTDCSCRSHLAYHPDRGSLDAAAFWDGVE